MRTLLFWVVAAIIPFGMAWLMACAGTTPPTVSVSNGVPCITVMANLPRNEGPITVTVTTDDAGIQTCVQAVNLHTGLAGALKETEFRKLDGG